MRTVWPSLQVERVEQPLARPSDRWHGAADGPVTWSMSAGSGARLRAPQRVVLGERPLRAQSVSPKDPLADREAGGA